MTHWNDLGNMFIDIRRHVAKTGSGVVATVVDSNEIKFGFEAGDGTVWCISLADLSVFLWSRCEQEPKSKLIRSYFATYGGRETLAKLLSEKPYSETQSSIPSWHDQVYQLLRAA